MSEVDNTEVASEAPAGIQLARVELVASLTGLGAAVVSLAITRSLLFAAVVLAGAAVAVINFRMLRWTWEGWLRQTADQSERIRPPLWVRFVLKVVVLISSLGAVLWLFKGSPAAFGIGVSNILLAVVINGFLPGPARREVSRT